MAQNILLHAWDALTKRLREVEWVDGGAKVHLGSLLSGENPTLNALGTIDADTEYQEGSAVTTATDITLGAVGAAGDYLGEVKIRLAAAGAVCTTTIKDGTVVLDSLTIVSQADNTTVTLPVKRQSKNGGWKLNCTCAGTMANIKYGAKGLFS